MAEGDEGEERPPGLGILGLAVPKASPEQEAAFAAHLQSEAWRREWAGKTIEDLKQRRAFLRERIKSGEFYRGVQDAPMAQAQLGPVFRAIHDLLQYPDAELAELPVAVLAGIQDVFGTLEHAARQLKEGALEGDRLLRSVAGSVRTALSPLDEAINRLQAKRRLSDSEREKLIEDQIDKSQRAWEYSTGLAKLSQQTLEVVQKVAETAGLTREARALSKAVQDHGRAAHRWQWAGIGCAASIISLALGTICWGEGPPIKQASWTAAANLAHFGSRVLLVSVLSFVLVVCVKNYRSAKHNQVVSYHRWSALATFRKFQAATEGNLQQIVLLQATEAIFGAQASGYAEKETAGYGTHVSELMRLIKDDPKGS